MCNLYRMTKNADEVAAWFDAVNAAGGANHGEEVYPGYPGLVAAGEQVRAMVWGFPLVMKGRSGQPLKPKPVNNCRTDKLDSFFWRYSFEERRCLIPLTGWAEAEGPKGAKTRTWLSLPDAPIFAAAGVWRESEEWGACYSMVMTDSAGSAAEDVHTRMPVLLAPDDYAGWVQGSPDEAKALCRPWGGDIALDRTDESWVKGRGTQQSLL
ncbi:SOS response-associated peptidase [Erythrobacter sp.]|jgi:putative SOS response-associated peptidase YedK|uniref:SOS response-associated peptidase n=1 Tax=Erythrobacter sp. TaxID=1042 RepID=UPI002EAF0CA1|nr:SOS response-associated peptidase family protein [Erythrobacter sp.]